MLTEIAVQKREISELDNEIEKERRFKEKLSTKLKNLKRFECFMQVISDDQNLQEKEFGGVLKRFHKLLDQASSLEQKNSDISTDYKKELLNRNKFGKVQADMQYQLKSRLIALQAESERQSAMEMKFFSEETSKAVKLSIENRLISKLHLSIDNIYSSLLENYGIGIEEKPSKLRGKERLNSQPTEKLDMSFDNTSSSKKLDILIQFVKELKY